jgi:Uma2 family endonuclease
VNAPVRSLAEGLPRRRFKVADVVRMVEVGLIGEDERLEVLGGEIVEMSPKGYRHEGLKGALNRLWGRTCPPGFDYLQETGLYLSDDTYLSPDFVAFSAATDLRDLKGAEVLLAIEIADSSLAYDLRRKPQIYASFGVRELWVIDVQGERTHVHRGPGADGFTSIEIRAADERLVPAVAPAELGFALAELGRR